MAKTNAVKKAVEMKPAGERSGMQKAHVKKMCFKRNIDSCSGGAVYGLGFIGSAVYYIAHATSFWMGVVGFCKALVWPAFLVYGLMKFIGM